MAENVTEHRHAVTLEIVSTSRRAWGRWTAWQDKLESLGKIRQLGTLGKISQ